MRKFVALNYRLIQAEIQDSPRKSCIEWLTATRSAQVAFLPKTASGHDLKPFTPSPHGVYHLCCMSGTFEVQKPACHFWSSYLGSALDVVSSSNRHRSSASPRPRGMGISSFGWSGDLCARGDFFWRIEGKRQGTTEGSSKDSPSAANLRSKGPTAKWPMIRTWAIFVGGCKRGMTVMADLSVWQLAIPVRHPVGENDGKR